MPPPICAPAPITAPWPTRTPGSSIASGCTNGADGSSRRGRCKRVAATAQAARLPDGPREVFELQYYLDLSQAEIATLLRLHPRKVSRLWQSAKDQLAAALPDGEAP